MASQANEQPTRRTFIRGTTVAAVGVGVGAAMYVKPSLQPLGITKAYASSSTTQSPPQLNGSVGTSPGYWGNNSKSGQGGGVPLWNTTNDPDWASAGGYTASNPFSNGDSGTGATETPPDPPTVFATWASQVGASMPTTFITDTTIIWLLVNGGNGGQGTTLNDSINYAAREFLVGYLNGSFFGTNFFPKGTTLAPDWLISAWNCTVLYVENLSSSNQMAVYNFFGSQLDLLNNVETTGNVSTVIAKYNGGLASAPSLGSPPVQYTCLPTL